MLITLAVIGASGGVPMKVPHAVGLAPTAMVFVTVSVAISMTDRLPPLLFVTYTDEPLDRRPGIRKITDRNSRPKRVSGKLMTETALAPNELLTTLRC